ncbi:MAG: hypothetical protein NC408_00795 [Candidatus Gastranaerophilales bacterium]|nr:hypothetical protein [Candidatus Gastranaerophilales bacterium]MCM1072928.1 hypothetical protein [Bacteroides sp.]
MKVNSNISFGGIYNNKALKKGLEFAADNGALFAATTTLALSLTARPAAILATPKTDKENKKLAFAKSLASTFVGYAMMFALSKPLAKKMKNINKNLTKESIENLKDEADKLEQSKAYILATQMFKLGLGMAAAIPKAILTAASVPVFMNQIFPEENKGLSFKGKSSDIITKTLNNKKYQEFAKKYKDTNFPMHIIAATDTLTTGTFIYQTKKSNKIKEERKDALCYNAGISTALSIASSYFADKLTDKPTDKFIKKFKQINKNDPNLDKYIEGIKIAKPILIIGGIYYILIPFISTFLADRAAK